MLMRSIDFPKLECFNPPGSQSRRLTCTGVFNIYENSEVPPSSPMVWAFSLVTDCLWILIVNAADRETRWDWLNWEWLEAVDASD